MKNEKMISKTEVDGETVVLFKARAGRKWAYFVATSIFACEHDNLIDAIECYKDKIDNLLR